MNKKDVKDLIHKYITKIECGKAEINIMFVDQNNQRKRRYKGLMLRTQNDDVKESIMLSCKYIEEELDRRSLDKYDLEISLDESTQMVKETDVIFGKDIINEFSVEYTDSNVINDSTDLGKIKFVAYQIYDADSEESMYIFTKYVQPSTAYKTSLKYIFTGGVLKPFTDEVITLTSVVDAILLGGNYFVFNRNSFNSIFAYKDVYKKILDDNLEMIEQSGLLTDSSKFVSDCEADGRYLTRLTKAILAKGFEEVSKRQEEVKKIAEDFDLSLDISDEGQIVYKGKEDIPEVLNLLLRHYVIDALTSNKMIASAIQEYEAGLRG